MIKVQMIVDNKSTPLRAIEYSDGACEVRFDEDALCAADNFVCLTIHPSTHVGHYQTIIQQFVSTLIGVMVIGWENKNADDVKVILNTPYLPHARADKTFGHFDTSVLHGFICSIMELLTYFTEWHIQDIHNPDAFNDTLIPLFELGDLPLPKIVHDEAHQIIAQHPMFKRISKDIDVVFSPDKGATERANLVWTKAVENEDSVLIQGSKVRNAENGWITHYELPPMVQVNKQTVLIVDDICDGGKTFEFAAEALRKKGAEKIYLYVTHGIFSKGLESLKFLDGLIVQNLVGGYVNEMDVMNFNIEAGLIND